MGAEAVISRRGLIGMFAAGAGAAIIRTPGLLMPVKAGLVTGGDGVLRMGVYAEQPLTWRPSWGFAYWSNDGLYEIGRTISCEWEVSAT